MKGRFSFVVAFAFMLFCLVGCKKKSFSLLPKVELQAGDVVLRCGSGLTSKAVLLADNGGEYSHVGIVVDCGGQKMIVHAVPGEHDGPDDVDRVKMDTPEDFFSSLKTSNGRVMRYADVECAKRAAEEACRLYRKGVHFDHDYSLSDTTQMYCSELVEFVYKNTSAVSITCGMRHDVALPMYSFRNLILPSDFVNSRCLTTILSF